MSVRWMAATGSCAVAVACFTAAPATAAGGSDYVETQSGKVRCLVSANGDGTDLERPVVICEANADGFLDAPLNEYGQHLHNAVVNEQGQFRFSDGGNIGGAGQGGDVTLRYGNTYRLQGWSILAAESGTRFTNDATGHGMFVSIENSYGF
jgi:hypothetical protein